jgi:peptidoglycan/xylan/chitin deacetylase (PgdA/CDA1 family)
MQPIPKPIRKEKFSDKLLTFFYRTGIFYALSRARPKALTVLNYHRIDDVSHSGFDSFTPNVTASPAEFARQMDYVKRHYNLVTCELVAAWLKGDATLPPYAAMITFDDGYYDNYAYAYPILRERNLPAVIFLTTDYIGRSNPFYWDFVSYCFNHTEKNSAVLPRYEAVSWQGKTEKMAVMKQWIERLKLLPNEEKQHAVAALENVLEVSVPESAFSGLHLSWDQVREMSQNGIEMGSHTATHPILTRVPLPQVEHELASSKQKIEAEINKPVIGIAYPNGGSADFSPEVIKLAQQTGYKVAFSLVGGVNTHAGIRKEPFAIRRIFLSAADSFPRFVTKLVLGMPISEYKKYFNK